MKHKLLNLKSFILILIGFTLGLFFVKATGILSNVSTGGQFSATTMNEIINRVMGISYNSGNKLMELEGGIKYNKLTTNICDTTSKGTIIFSGTAFYGCNGTSWNSLTGASSSVNYFGGSGTISVPWIISAGTVSTSCQYYNLNATTKNDGTSRGTGTCGNGSQGCLNDGYYRITTSSGPTQLDVYCDMSGNGGGRSLVMVAQGQENCTALGVGTAYGSSYYATLNHTWKYSDAIMNSILNGGQIRTTSDQGDILFYYPGITIDMTTDASGDEMKYSTSASGPWTTNGGRSRAFGSRTNGSGIPGNHVFYDSAGVSAYDMYESSAYRNCSNVSTLNMRAWVKG